ncbi:alpha/beta hydrolase [Mycobacterium spongiae]|uniref:Alpha/beta hydrolase fold domain-containing protein n=1 Tax=Mycobacterium spongiae TaxID=886343 RepID=A0A975PWZ8_9MYCO|nr:alpha/beta hydrolase fold domain-containing protein [Mycobacterium spongiae]QUR67736.1 alpha/beta hydrolase fold domain-containing protein [Mycobacterium spongiae]
MSGPDEIATAAFEPPEPGRSAAVLAAVVRRSLRPVLSGVRPGRRAAGIRRIVVAVERLATRLRVPLGTPVAGASMHRIDLGGCGAEWIAAPRAHVSKPAILYFHGGGFIVGGPQTHRRLVSRLSAVCGGAPVLSVEYRQLPHVSVQASVADCVAAYRYLLRRHPPSEIVVAGDSAGGHLALAVAAAARTLDLPQPAGIAVISPWVDLTADRPRHRNVRRDPYVTPSVLAWIGHLHHVRFGPLRTDLCDPDHDMSGLAPTLIQVGGLEILVADAEALAARLAAVAVPCQLQIYPGQMHVFQLFADILPEARRALREFAAFVDERTRSPASESASHDGPDNPDAPAAAEP